ncbi:ribosome maturation factor RimM [Portibacter marinus]|uniref:ribosome maturation factor RimM n=1 Tax=Portibacter marinus TaxID=2898660 RepID=UPI001F45F85F|nr:hypothetical protein [Portibacter marinus]
MNITDYFPDYTEIGYAKKSYGVNGQMRTFVEEQYDSSLAKSEHCFFLLKGCLVPYFIEDYDNNLIKFESCHNPEDTKELASRTMYLHKDQLANVSQVEEKKTFAFAIGYSVIDEEEQIPIGIIQEIEEYPEQEIAVVQGQKHQYLIPLNFSNVAAIDQDQQTIYVEIPEGLLDLNTGE